MLSNRNIIVFGDDWGKYPSTMQHMGRILARENRLMWIGSLGLRKPKFSLYDAFRIWEKGKKLFSNTNSVKSENNVMEVNPLVIPFHNSGFARRINAKTIRDTIVRKMKEHDFSNPILLTSSPLISNLIGAIGETSSHYICLDDWSEFDDAFENLLDLEKDLLEKVDACFSVSKMLLETRKTISGEDHYLPQGVDTEHFQVLKGRTPECLQLLPRPIIGYFGLFASYVDVDLFIQTARKYPNGSVVLLGKTKINLDELFREPNIHYFGEIPFTELPRYASAFEVGLIPFKVNTLTIAANPLKLLEYMSMGIPVVSTNLPEVARFDSLVSVAQNNEDFVNLIGTALQDNTSQRNLIRRDEAKKFSWQKIVSDFSDVVLRIEKEKHISRAK
ncbi:MAG: glycosyltransferase [Ignavibacteriae bacterium]|nr:glycosyltransferase [Ignavibacteriota bacterium]